MPCPLKLPTPASCLPGAILCSGRNLAGFRLEEGEWAAFYLPDFRRFDMGEAKRHPMELNQAVLRKRLIGEDGEWLIPHTWILRTPKTGSWLDSGIIMAPGGGNSRWKVTMRSWVTSRCGGYPVGGSRGIFVSTIEPLFGSKALQRSRLLLSTTNRLTNRQQTSQVQPEMQPF